jgi:hypothetical protein
VGEFRKAWTAVPRGERVASVAAVLVYAALELPALYLLIQGGHLGLAFSLIAAAHLFAFAFGHWLRAHQRERGL